MKRLEVLATRWLKVLENLCQDREVLPRSSLKERNPGDYFSKRPARVAFSDQGVMPPGLTGEGHVVWGTLSSDFQVLPRLFRALHRDPAVMEPRGWTTERRDLGQKDGERVSS